MTPLAEKNQVVLLTGATRGIGRATALSYAAAGARLVLNYAANDHALDSLLQEAALPDDRLIVVKGLVQDPQVSRHMVRAALARWGRIDHLINNAGAIRDVPMALMQASTWDEILAVNLDSVFHCCKHASRPMVAARRGSIVNVSSLTATRGRLGQTHYGAAKAGVLGLTRSLSHELGRYNVRVNAVVVGFVDTDMTAALPLAVRSDVTAHCPLGRWGRPDEVASVVRFLTSDAASYVTGTSIEVTGGM